jgi:L-malate glycosyltransferase
MNILVIPSWYPPNGGQFFREHAIALSKEGAAITVLAAPNTSLRDFSLQKLPKLFEIVKTQSGNFQEIVMPYWNIPRAERLNFYGWTNMMQGLVESHIEKHGLPDLIQTHSSLWAGFVAYKLKKKFNISYVITEHRSRFVSNSHVRAKLFKSWYLPALRCAFEHADAIVAVSPSLHQKIRDLGVRENPPLNVIFNMVDTDFFMPKPNKVPNFTPPFRFFCLAYLEWVKGIDVLINAMALLNKQAPNQFMLTIGGGGSQEDHLKQLVHELELESVISFKGSLDRQQILQEMHNADAFVLPSRFEAFGVVYIEAMACGLPVIATRSGGPEAFICPSVGVLVPTNDHFLLAKEMISMRERYSDFDSEVIRKYAVENFGLQNIARKYMKLYANLTNVS